MCVMQVNWNLSVMGGLQPSELLHANGVLVHSVFDCFNPTTAGWQAEQLNNGMIATFIVDSHCLS